MGIRASEVLYYLYHYDQLRAMIQWKTWHNPVHQRNPEKECPSLKNCFLFLDLTSRSFSAVIQELHPELLVPVVLFYLVLRGLDTIEDDMTIPLETKEPMLRTFHTIIEKAGWNFDGNGPNEKDRELLVQFQNVIEEFNKIKPVYRAIIKDITEKMGNGMADYANNAEHNATGVNTVADYDLYCHYVAGLVGEGLTRLFVVSELANPELLRRPQLHESMGRFLQKTNIIRDVHEDFVDKRIFWPKEIWSKYVDKFEDLFDPKNIDISLNCSSEMVLNALGHVNECIFYLAGIREQSVFNFTTIPQTMAIATLEVVFRNPKVFRQNVKITKGQACQIMLDSTQNLRVACEVFKKFARKIQKKNNPRDPNFLKISIACGKIEQFIESLYPSVDPKTIGLQPSQAELEKSAAKKASEKESLWDTIYLLVAVMSVLFFISALMIGVAWYMGARVDVAFNEIKQGKFARPNPAIAQEAIKKYDRGEL